MFPKKKHNKKMKRFTALLFIIPLLLTGCAAKMVPDEKCVISWSGGETYSDNGAFYSRSSSIMGGDVICRYSIDTGLTVPLCNKPDCTHNIKTSPDCNALARQPKAMCAANGKLYFTELDREEDNLNMICADINGGNRKKIAVVEHGAMSAGFIDHMRYQDGKLIYTSYDMFDTELIDSANEIKTLDKYIATVRSIDLTSGEVKVLAKRQEYNARISNAYIDGDTLIYFISYYTAPLSVENGYTEDEFNNAYRYGVYTVDLKTGEEKCLTEGYNRMALANPCYDYFSYDRLVFYSTDTNELYRYNVQDNSFTPFAECANINSWYISDDKAALFLEHEDDEYFCRYDFDSGETAHIPREGFTPVWLNGTITGEKAWFGYIGEDGEYCMGYICRDDLMNGEYGGFKFAYYVNGEA